jgi:hypothetical protein
MNSLNGSLISFIESQFIEISFYNFTNVKLLCYNHMYFAYTIDLYT